MVKKEYFAPQVVYEFNRLNDVLLASNGDEWSPDDNEYIVKDQKW